MPVESAVQLQSLSPPSAVGTSYLLSLPESYLLDDGQSILCLDAELPEKSF